MLLNEDTLSFLKIGSFVLVISFIVFKNGNSILFVSFINYGYEYFIMEVVSVNYDQEFKRYSQNTKLKTSAPTYSLIHTSILFVSFILLVL